MTIPLSRRQLQVLKMTADGYETKQTAAELGISPETIRTLRKQILQRLLARNMYHAVSIGHKEGIL